MGGGVEFLQSTGNNSGILGHVFHDVINDPGKSTDEKKDQHAQGDESDEAAFATTTALAAGRCRWIIELLLLIELAVIGAHEVLGVGIALLYVERRSQGARSQGPGKQLPQIIERCGEHRNERTMRPWEGREQN